MDNGEKRKINWIYAAREDSRYEMYKEMEKRYSRGHERRCINRKYTASCKCTGFCLYEKRPCFMTRELIEEHRCCEQGCLYSLAKPKKVRG